MKYTYTARKVTLRDNFKERAEKKLDKFGKLFSENATVNIVVTLEKNRQTVEVTIRDNGLVLRAESTMPEMNDALDKDEKKIKSGSIDDFVSLSPEINEAEDDDYKIMRKKHVIIKPITVDEAILEMNMVNHNFFMFKNADTDEINVVYKRENGDYGLLEPTV